MIGRGITDTQADPVDAGADPALIYDTLARAREADEQAFGPQRQDTTPRHRPGSWGPAVPSEPTGEGLAVLARWRAIWAAEGLA